MPMPDEDPRASEFRSQIERIRARAERRAMEAQLAQQPEMTLADWDAARETYAKRRGVAVGRGSAEIVGQNGQRMTFRDEGAPDFRSSAMQSEMARLLRERNEQKKLEEETRQRGYKTADNASTRAHEIEVEKLRSQGRITEAEAAARLRETDPGVLSAKAQLAETERLREEARAAREKAKAQADALRAQYPQFASLPDEELIARAQEFAVAPRAAEAHKASLAPRVREVLTTVQAAKVGETSNLQDAIIAEIQQAIDDAVAKGIDQDTAKKNVADAFRPVIAAMQKKLDDEYERQFNPLYQPLTFLPNLMGAADERKKFTAF